MKSNTFSITLEINRVIICCDIFAVVSSYTKKMQSGCLTLTRFNADIIANNSLGSNSLGPAALA